MGQACQMYYVPQHVITPMHEKKGDLELNVQGLYSISGSASYAFTDQFFAGLSVNRYADKDTHRVDNFVMSGTTMHLGYLYQTPDHRRRFELMGGAGLGSIREDFSIPFTRIFIQPSYGFIDDNIESIVSLRVNNMIYGKDANATGKQGNFNIGFIEPAYTFRGGSPYVKFQAQLGLSVPYTAMAVPDDFAYAPFFMSLGLSCKINTAPQPKPVVQP